MALGRRCALRRRCRTRNVRSGAAESAFTTCETLLKMVFEKKQDFAGFLSRQRSMETEGLKGCLLTRHFFLKSTHTLRAQNVYPDALSPVILLHWCNFLRLYAQPRLGAPSPVVRLSIEVFHDESWKSAPRVLCSGQLRARSWELVFAE